MDLEQVKRIRTMATWLRRSSRTAEQYPKRDQLSGTEIFDAKQFASGVYPWPSRWTIRLTRLAKEG
jgi:hypothetical protein